MVTHPHSRIFSPGGCLTPQAIRAYLDGKMTGASKIQVEEHIRRCRLCSKALEGFRSHHRMPYVQSDLNFLSKKVRKKYIPEGTQPLRKLPLLILISLAISIVLLLAIIFIIRMLQAGL